MERKNVTIDGTELRWHEAAGDGPPVVFIHGLSTGPELWRDVIPQVPARALAFEMVGHASSIPQGRDRDISLAAQSRYLWDWLDAIEVERPLLVGHDLGGGVAQIAAVERPDDVAGLVLTNAVSYDSWPIPAVTAMSRFSGIVSRLPDATFKGILATLMARGHDQADVARRSFDIHWEHYERHGAADALARQTDSLRTEDTLAIADRLPDLRIPARIVWGVADQFQKPRYAERLARDLGTRPIAIPGGKHFTPEDHAPIVAATVRSLLDEVAGAPSKPAGAHTSSRP